MRPAAPVIRTLFLLPIHPPSESFSPFPLLPGQGTGRADGRLAFPDRRYEAVVFGNPTPSTDWGKDTAYVAQAAREHAALWPLVLAGPALGVTREAYEKALDTGGFYGFKVFLNWYGDDYGQLTVQEMFGPAELALMNERRLVVILHVPRSGRLADPDWVRLYPRSEATVIPTPGHYKRMEAFTRRSRGRVLYAGDWLTGSTIEGAVRTGFLAAEQVLAAE